jgi:hypothetical protein
VFPAFTPEYEQVLLTLCAGGVTTDLEFLVQLLGSYNGQTFTHTLGKAIIEALPANDPLLRHIGTALALTGTLTGEFGRVQAYREKKQALEQWLADPRERVREFAKGEIHDLEMQIAGEQRRSEEALEFRKRSYESPSEDAKDV